MSQTNKAETKTDNKTNPNKEDNNMEDEFQDTKKTNTEQNNDKYKQILCSHATHITSDRGDNVALRKCDRKRHKDCNCKQPLCKELPSG